MSIDLTDLTERSKGPGKFEGEGPEALYFYEASMNGEGEDVYDECGEYAGTVFRHADLTAEEKEVFDIAEGEDVVLTETETGFVYCYFQTGAVEAYCLV